MATPWDVHLQAIKKGDASHKGIIYSGKKILERKYEYLSNWTQDLIRKNQQ